MASGQRDGGLSDQMLDRVLSRLGLAGRPSLDLEGLNTLYAAFCGAVPADNVQKRIWFSAQSRTPPPGGDPVEFFENWLRHGTGGTCFPLNGALCALAESIGFEARRIAGSMRVAGYTHPDNHGSVLVRLEGRDYLVDAQIGAFRVLPLVPGRPASTGDRIHDIQAAPREGGFDILWYSGVNREQRKTFRIQPGYDPVDSGFFLAAYERTREPGRDLFNHALYVCRRFPDSILSIVRHRKVIVSPDGSWRGTEMEAGERERVLVEEVGLSEEVVARLPADSDYVAAW